MKILDLKNSFIRHILANKIEKIFRQNYEITPSIILTDVAGFEHEDSVTVNANVQIVISKKDLGKIILK